MKFKNQHKSLRRVHFKDASGALVKLAAAAGETIELTPDQVEAVAENKGAQAVLKSLERVREPGNPDDAHDNDPEWLRPKEEPKPATPRPPRTTGEAPKPDAEPARPLKPGQGKPPAPAVERMPRSPAKPEPVKE